MTNTSALITVVVGVGLAVLTANYIPGRKHDAERGRRAALLTMALQLIGWMLAGAALFIPAAYAEKNQSVVGGDLKVENWFIAALAGMMVVVVIRNAWAGFVRSSPDSPWNPGFLDRAYSGILFVGGAAFIALLGMCTDWALIKMGDSTRRIGGPVLMLVLLFLVVSGVVSLIVRYVLVQDVSSGAATMSRRQQGNLLQELGDAPGSWLSIGVRAAAELDPCLVFSATIWSTDRGWYWRPDDAYALARYHLWAGSRARTPLAALHLQRVSVIAGKFGDSIRGMRITSTTSRLWWLDAWRTHRRELPLIDDADSPERRAALVHIAREQLQEAGLVVTVRPASRVAWAVAPVANQPSPVAPARAHGTHETTIPGRAAPTGRRSLPPPS
jgi:hypothetical protein